MTLYGMERIFDMEWQGWIITANWYDDMGRGEFCGGVERTRTEAIRQFMKNSPEDQPWRSHKRQGWRCVKCVVRWPASANDGW